MMKMTSIDVTSTLRKKYGLRNESAKVFLAEFLGTFLLIAFGDGAVAQKVLTGGTLNNYVAVVWGYSLGVVMGITSSGNVSGGHLNPAVTLAMALWGRLAWPMVPIYMVAQYLGAFAASVLLFGIYSNALSNFEEVPSMATAGIWATYPGSMVNVNGTAIDNYLTSGNGFGDQVVGTMLLLICVCAITDPKNMNIPKWLIPLMVGFVVMNIGFSFGMNCGFAINPARDLAPRIFTLIAGWGELPFTTSTVNGTPWWWIPIVASHIGGILGMLVYTLLIEMHHQDDSDTSSQPSSPNYETHITPEIIDMKSAFEERKETTQS